MSDPAVETWRKALGQSLYELATVRRQWAADVDALIRARQETERLAEDVERLREEIVSLRRQLVRRGHGYHLTDKGLAAIQADTEETS